MQGVIGVVGREQRGGNDNERKTIVVLKGLATKRCKKIHDSEMRSSPRRDRSRRNFIDSVSTVLALFSNMPTVTARKSTFDPTCWCWLRHRFFPAHPCRSHRCTVCIPGLFRTEVIVDCHGDFPVVGTNLPTTNSEVLVQRWLRFASQRCGLESRHRDVCKFKTPPCVHSKRHRFGCTHGSALNLSHTHTHHTYQHTHEQLTHKQHTQEFRRRPHTEAF